MKKYNKFNYNTFFLWITSSLLVFLLAINITYAYFSAKTLSQTTTETAVLTIKFSDDTTMSVNSQTIVDGIKLLPGDSLTATGKIENNGELKVYTLIKFDIQVEKTSEEEPSKVATKYYTFVGDVLTEITENNETYSHNAFTINNSDSINFSISYEFDFYEFDNEYMNATVSYTLTALAIQHASIDSATSATSLLMEQAKTL